MSKKFFGFAVTTSEAGYGSFIFKINFQFIVQSFGNFFKNWIRYVEKHYSIFVEQNLPNFFHPQSPSGQRQR